MANIRKALGRHILASIINFPIIFLIWGYLNPEITKLLTGEYPDVMFLPESAAFNCCRSIFIVIFLFIPISAFGEKYLIERYSLAAWIHIPLILIIIGIATFVIWLLLNEIMGPINWDAFAIVAFNNALWGGTYWVSFLLLRKFFSRNESLVKKIGVEHRMKKVTPISNFIFRHFVASVVSVLTPVILLTIVYAVLFIIAISTNSNLGSPIALPLMGIFVFVVSTLYTAIFLFPSVVIAEIISRKFGKWKHVAQISTSLMALAFLTYLVGLLLRTYPNYPQAVILHWADYPFLVFLVLLIPLGIYWWTMKIVQAGVSLPFVFFKRLKNTSNSKEK